jgi:DNA primase
MKVDVPRMLFALGIRDAVLRRNEWWAKCPFPSHKDTEPSWSIRDQPELQSHGFHKCFGCKQGGGPSALVQACIGITPQSAVRWLHENGLVLGRALGGIPEIKVTVGNSPIKTAPPSMVVFLPLGEWPRAAKEYLHNRGITPQHVLRYQLGYAVHGRLAGRIVFPCYDEQGRMTNYTARSFTGDSRRYLNPNSFEGYPIKQSIFGEHLWPDLPRDMVFVSEGAINALALDAALGGKVAVAALLGSKISPTQVLKLSRFSTLVYVADPDFTGMEFACTVEAALCNACDVHVVQLVGTDAADTPRQQLKETLANGEFW